MTNLTDKLKHLGITSSMIEACKMPSYDEAVELVDAGSDMFGRPQQMTPATLDAWLAMQAAAAEQGIELKLVSAYRSIDYQCDVIARKLDDGRTIEDILCANAIPGHSEHHTGCALDLHSGESEPLIDAFETTSAFSWLTQNAESFNFFLSYPKDNDEGIDYEPWHWCYRG